MRHNFPHVWATKELHRAFKITRKNQPDAVREHIRNWTFYPLQERNVGHLPSPYAQKTKGFRAALGPFVKVAPNLVDAAVYGFSKLTRRNMMIFKDGERVASHVVFQKHGDALKMYHVFTAPGRRNQGLGTYSVIQFLEYARKRKGIKWARIGGGNDPAVLKIYDYLSKNQKELRIECVDRLEQKSSEQRYWVRFVKI